MALKELKLKSPKELESLFQQLKRDLIEYKFKKSLKTLKKPHLIKETKRQLAQILSIQRSHKK